MKKIFLFLFLSFFAITSLVYAKGNTNIQSFSESKNILENKVYSNHRITFYCKAKYDENKNVILPEGFKTPAYEERSHKIEWEHIVPAEAFGKNFSEWEDGSEMCLSSKGRYKGRHCAEVSSKQFRLMEADMHNLVPAIGSVNALRQNYHHIDLNDDNIPYTFGSCRMKIYNKKSEPPYYTKGFIARTYLYMEKEYKKWFKIPNELKKQLLDWNQNYPPTFWEIKRNEIIKSIQGNGNYFIENYGK